MNVCLISFDYPPTNGGIGTYTHALAHGLVERGHAVHIITLSADQDNHQVMDGSVYVHQVATKRWPLPKPLRVRGAHTVGLVERSISVAHYVKGLHRSIGFDVVEAPNWDAEALVYSFRPPVPLVIRVSTTFLTAEKINDRALQASSLDRQRRSRFRSIRATFRLRLRHWLETAPVRRAAGVIAISQYVAEVAQHTYGLPYNRVHVVPLGLDLAADAPVSVPWSQARVGETMSGPIALANTAVKPVKDTSIRPTILYVGRLEQRKGTRHLLEAIPDVVAAVPNVRFRIIGKDTRDAVNGMSHQAYFAHFASSEVQRAVTFLDHVGQDRLDQEYAACTVFVAPSLSESFGLVHLEAMMRGKPVVACRAGATPEIVVDGENGLLVPVENSYALAHAIIHLLLEPRDARRMGEQGRLRALNTFTLDHMVDRTLAVYTALVRQQAVHP